MLHPVVQPARPHPERRPTSPSSPSPSSAGATRSPRWCKAILDEVARTFGAEAAPSFEKASYLQINYCLPTPAERDLLQDKHEDGHMVTVLHATAPGLEIYPGRALDEVKPMLPGPDEIVIMPGSVLTALSGGKIQPLYHQVRNHGLDDRQSLMYFVNPEIDEPLFGWIDVAGRRARRHPRARAERAVDVRPAAGRGALTCRAFRGVTVSSHPSSARSCSGESSARRQAAARCARPARVTSRRR